MAGLSGDFNPIPLCEDNCYRLIADNPVSGARFFNFIVTKFIEHVLGIDSDYLGFFGTTKAYYGTVKQQGRLTLHIHMLLWIKNACSPQEIRDKLLDSLSCFSKELVAYLESCHSGNYLDASFDEVKSAVNFSDSLGQINSTETLPCTPPQLYHPLCDRLSLLYPV